MTKPKPFLEVTLEDATTVTLGEKPKPENKVKLRVKGLVGATVSWLKLTVPWGPQDPALVLDKKAAGAAKPELNDAYSNDVSIDLDSEVEKEGTGEGTYTWIVSGDLMGFSLEHDLEMTLSGFRSAGGKEAVLTVQLAGIPPEGEMDEFEPETLKIPKKFDAPDKLQIIYFTIDNHHFSEEGDAIKIKWSVSKLATKVELLKNDTRFRELALTDSPALPELFFAGEETDDPSAKETRYSLRITDKDNKQETSEPVTVEVLQPGWRRFRYTTPFDKPLAFFKAEDEAKYETLYAIFRTAGSGTPLLYSSEHLDVWKLEPGSIPAGMESSPAVRTGDNKLWLVGGSSAEVGILSNRIYFYDLKLPREHRKWCCADCGKPHDECQWDKEEREKAKRWSRRMGHTCVVFKGELWVLGGFDSRGRGRKDVWKWTTEGKWEPLDEAPWSGRCLSAAAVHKGKLHFFGGVAQPYAFGEGERANDHYTFDGSTWTNLTEGGGDEASADVPLACAFAELQGQLFLCKTYKAGNVQKLTFSSWNSFSQRTYTEVTADAPWEDFGVVPYALTAVANKGLLYVRALADSASLQKPTAVHVYKPKPR